MARAPAAGWIFAPLTLRAPALELSARRHRAPDRLRL